MVEFSKNVTFEKKTARFDVILTSVIIIKIDFPCKSFCNKSLVGSEIAKHQNLLSLAHLIALGIVTSSLMSTQ